MFLNLGAELSILGLRILHVEDAVQRVSHPNTAKKVTALLTGDAIGEIRNLGTALDAVLQPASSYATDRLSAVADIKSDYAVEELLASVDIMAIRNIIAVEALEAERRIGRSGEVVSCGAARIVRENVWQWLRR